MSWKFDGNQSVCALFRLVDHIAIDLRSFMFTQNEEYYALLAAGTVIRIIIYMCVYTYSICREQSMLVALKGKIVNWHFLPDIV